MLVFTGSIIAIAVAAFLQTANIFVVGFIKPNVVFALLVVLSHVHKDWVKRAFLVLVPALILKFSPAIAWVDAIFIATSFFVVALVDYLPWKRLINSIFAVIAGTVILGAPSFDIVALTTELVFNIILVAAFFIIFEKIYEKEAKKQKNKF
jgi:hypothetical protein